MSEPKKKIVGPLELTVFIGVLILLAYIVLKSGGGSIIERTETVEIVNDNNRIGKAQNENYRSQDKDAGVEEILRQIEDQYSGTPGTTPSSDKSVPSAKMSKDERQYLESVKEEKEKKARDEGVDWFSVLRASHKTYKNVKSVFEKAGIDVQAAENVTSELANEAVARSFYSNLEKTFQIPEEEARAFAGKGQKALSDWARFVEEKDE